MVDIQSKEVIDKISDDLKIQPALQIPRELAKQIQLTYNINPKFNNAVRFVAAGRATTGSTTIFTTSADRRTFLTGVHFQYQHDAAVNSTFLALSAVPVFRNVAENIIIFNKITLTANQDRVFVPFPVPMELAPSSSIVITQTFTLGVGVMNGGITFYEVDPQ